MAVCRGARYVRPGRRRRLRHGASQGMTAPRPTRKPRPQWAEARRIVVKIGSSLIVDPVAGGINATWLEALAQDVASLAGAGKQVILVSSGAIALGRHVLGLPRGVLELERSQAAAAVGQISLAGAYQAVLGAHGLTAA